MKAKLIKDSDGFNLCIPHETTNEFIASTSGMYMKHTLSLKNCQEIECCVDLDTLVLSFYPKTEWDVEIKMICPHPEDTYVCGIQYGCDEDGCNYPNKIPLLDANNCLILSPI